MLEKSSFKTYLFSCSSFSLFTFGEGCLAFHEGVELAQRAAELTAAVTRDAITSAVL